MKTDEDVDAFAVLLSVLKECKLEIYCDLASQFC